ncbi:MFS transporter [Thiotrichales bacterium 19S3-7]|nr:MFS transporter [Thiotrichales bacterium 19S3-7]MCF6800553.1 MFS transporter [Thiotrichales bacterium 19S3-11]
MKLKLPREYLQSYSILTLSEFISGMLVPLATLIFFSQVTPFFSSDTEADKLWLYGIFASLTQFAAMFSNPIIGSISDLIGRKRSLFVCVGGIWVLALLAVIAIVLKNFWLLLLGYILYNLVSATKVVCMASINDISQKHNKVLYVSLIQFFIGIGFMFGPLLSSHIAETNLIGIYFLWPFLIIFLGGLCLGVFIYFYFKDTYLPQKKIYTNQLMLCYNNGKRILGNSKLRWLVILLILDQAAWGGYYLFAPVIGRVHFKLSASGIGLFVSLVGVCLIVISGVIIPILYRFCSQKAMLLIACIMMLFGVVTSWAILWFEPNIVSESLYWISLLPTLLGDVMIFSIVSALMSNAATHDIQGNVAGFIYVVAMLSWSLVGLLNGYLAHYRLANAVLMPAIMVILMTIYVLLLRNKLIDESTS